MPPDHNPMDVDIEQVWLQASERAKDKIIQPTLWRAVEIARPVTIDGDFFVVGFGTGQLHMAGHLTSAENRNILEAGIYAATGKKLRLAVIDGTDIADWNNYKARQKAAEAQRQKTMQRAAKEMETARTWDGVFEQLGRAYASLHLRQLPQMRGKYIDFALELISTAMDELYDEQNADEATQRSLARVIDRVGVLTEVPPAIIAVELMRFRRSNS